MLPNPDEQRIHIERRTRRWQFLSLGGGLLLAASFFMPAIQACNSPAIPAAYAYDSIGDPWTSWPLAFCWFVAAYLFGLLVALAAGFRMRNRRRAAACVHRVIPVLIFVVAVYVPAHVIVETWRNRTQNGWNHWPSVSELWAGKGTLIVLFAAPLTLVIYLWRCRKRGDGRWIGHVFAGSVWCTVWFGIYLAETPASQIYYGLVCPFAASFLVMTGILGETRVLSGQSCLRVLQSLCIAPVPPLLANRGFCQRCGYYLLGLPEPRCPECGTPFDWKDVQDMGSLVEPRVLEAGT